MTFSKPRKKVYFTVLCSLPLPNERAESSPGGFGKRDHLAEMAWRSSGRMKCRHPGPPFRWLLRPLRILQLAPWEWVNSGWFVRTQHGLTAFDWGDLLLIAFTFLPDEVRGRCGRGAKEASEESNTFKQEILISFFLILKSGSIVDSDCD